MIISLKMIVSMALTRNSKEMKLNAIVRTLASELNLDDLHSNHMQELGTQMYHFVCMDTCIAVHDVKIYTPVLQYTRLIYLRGIGLLMFSG